MVCKNSFVTFYEQIRYKFIGILVKNFEKKNTGRFLTKNDQKRLKKGKNDPKKSPAAFLRQKLKTSTVRTALFITFLQIQIFYLFIRILKFN